MSNARFFDGKSLIRRDVAVERRGESLWFAVDGKEHLWPIAKVDAVIARREARLAWRGERDARLVLAAPIWRELAGRLYGVSADRKRRRERWIAGSLAIFAASTLLFVFVGVPRMSGPLARATPPAFEERLGDNMDRQVSRVLRQCPGREGQVVLNTLGDRLASSTDTPFDIRVQAVQAPFVNAVALPGGRIWVSDDLIREAQNPDELAAVVAHEVAHIEQRHSMQAVLRSLGIGMVLDAVVGGGTGAGQQAVILAGNATEMSYSRDDEQIADARGQALLHAQGLSSLGMATFFERLDQVTGEPSAEGSSEFMATHPNSHRRAVAARAIQRPGKSALTPTEWAVVRAACDEVDYEQIEEMRQRIETGIPPRRVRP